MTELDEKYNLNAAGHGLFLEPESFAFTLQFLAVKMGRHRRGGDRVRHARRRQVGAGRRSQLGRVALWRIT